MHNIQSIEKMNLDQEYMITLSRLQLPANANVQRLALSITSDLSQQQFIQNCKTVKRDRVNFYRESLFVASIASGLHFKVYEITNNEQQLLLKIFSYSVEELKSVRKQAAMFHTQVDGFELVWECCVFNAQESDQNQETDKEYTELRDDLDQEEEVTQMSDIFVESHSNVDNTQEQSRNTEGNFKKSNSTDDTFLAKSPEERNWRMDEDFHIEPAQGYELNDYKSKKIESEAGKEQYKKRPHIKSHIYSQLLSGITELFVGGRT